jgi:hypothetical protein
MMPCFGFQKMGSGHNWDQITAVDPCCGLTTVIAVTWRARV